MERGGAPRIFLVDDEQINLRVMRIVLERAGYTNVAVIDDPRAVIGEHRRDPADLVLLDLTMPDLDGLAVMKQLQEEREQPTPKVIVITGHSDKETTDKVLSAGAMACISKPIRVDQVVDAVRSALGRVVPM